jgi:endonuclease YncB( thermonuclease family)
VALSLLLWPANATAWHGKVVEVDPATVDRYGRTVAFVKVRDTVVNEELIRQGLARVFSLRPGDLP